MSPGQPSQPRRRYLVKRGLQLRYMALLMFCMLAAAVGVGGIFYLETWGTIIHEFSAAQLADKLETAARMRDYEIARDTTQAQQALRLFKEAQLLSAHEQSTVAQLLRRANARMVLRLLFLMMAIACASILLSHRLAGPIYRFERTVQDAAAGHLDVTFTLRQGDELQDLADALDRLMTSWRQRLGTAHTALRDLATQLQGLSTQSTLSDRDRAVVFQLQVRVDDAMRALQITPPSSGPGLR